MLRLLIGEYLMRRLFGSSRHRRTYSHGWGRPRYRSRRRVHVTGCCLPIPLGVLVVLVAAGRLVLRR